MDALDPQAVAKIAVQLTPRPSCDDPAKAVELAREILIAADPELAKQRNEEAEKTALMKEAERVDRLFPPRERISITEAFKVSPGNYKTESRFVAALRKNNLTYWRQEGDVEGWLRAWPNEEDRFVQRREVTTIRAVKELFKLQHERKKALDRVRKQPSKEKIRENRAEISEQKAESKSEKRKAGTPKRKLTGKKRKVARRPK